MIECSIHGCRNVHVAKGFCRKHYMRHQRHGHILETRQSDWGTRAKHPLYKTWKNLIRYQSANGELCEEWGRDFWQFVKDVSERPSKNHRLCRKDDSEVYSSNNWYWREFGEHTPEVKKNRKEYTAQWLRKRRASDAEFGFKQGLKRGYGLTAEQYYEMHESQGRVCAICKGNETSVSHHTGKIRRLAVDHCHATGKIRGLLCTNCNHGISSLKDSISNLQSAIKYLGKS